MCWLLRFLFAKCKSNFHSKHCIGHIWVCWIADQTWKNASRWNYKLPRKKLAALFIVASNVAKMNPRYVALRNLLTWTVMSITSMQFPCTHYAKWRGFPFNLLYVLHVQYSFSTLLYTYNELNLSLWLMGAPSFHSTDQLGVCIS
jgi:hypothetical protein